MVYDPNGAARRRLLQQMYGNDSLLARLQQRQQQVDAQRFPEYDALQRPKTVNAYIEKYGHEPEGLDRDYYVQQYNDLLDLYTAEIDKSVAKEQTIGGSENGAWNTLQRTLSVFGALAHRIESGALSKVQELFTHDIRSALTPAQATQYQKVKQLRSEVAQLTEQLDSESAVERTRASLLLEDKRQQLANARQTLEEYRPFDRSDLDILTQNKTNNLRTLFMSLFQDDKDVGHTENVFDFIDSVDRQETTLQKGLDDLYERHLYRNTAVADLYQKLSEHHHEKYAEKFKAMNIDLDKNSYWELVKTVMSSKENVKTVVDAMSDGARIFWESDDKFLIAMEGVAQMAVIAATKGYALAPLGVTYQGQIYGDAVDAAAEKGTTLVGRDAETSQILGTTAASIDTLVNTLGLQLVKGTPSKLAASKKTPILPRRSKAAIGLKRDTRTLKQTQGALKKLGKAGVLVGNATARAGKESLGIGARSVRRLGQLGAVIAPRTLMQAANEYATEASQGVLEQAAQHVTIKELDWAEVHAAALTGGVSGALVGGVSDVRAVGRYLYLRNQRQALADQLRDQEVPPYRSPPLNTQFSTSPDTDDTNEMEFGTRQPNGTHSYTLNDVEDFFEAYALDPATGHFGERKPSPNQVEGMMIFLTDLVSQYDEDPANVPDMLPKERDILSNLTVMMADYLAQQQASTAGRATGRALYDQIKPLIQTEFTNHNTRDLGEVLLDMVTHPDAYDDAELQQFRQLWRDNKMSSHYRTNAKQDAFVEPQNRQAGSDDFDLSEDARSAIDDFVDLFGGEHRDVDMQATFDAMFVPQPQTEATNEKTMGEVNREISRSSESGHFMGFRAHTLSVASAVVSRAPQRIINALLRFSDFVDGHELKGLTGTYVRGPKAGESLNDRLAQKVQQEAAVLRTVQEAMELLALHEFTPEQRQHYAKRRRMGQFQKELQGQATQSPVPPSNTSEPPPVDTATTPNSVDIRADEDAILPDEMEAILGQLDLTSDEPTSTPPPQGVSDTQTVTPTPTQAVDQPKTSSAPTKITGNVADLPPVVPVEANPNGPDAITSRGRTFNYTRRDDTPMNYVEGEVDGGLYNAHSYLSQATSPAVQKWRADNAVKAQKGLLLTTPTFAIKTPPSSNQNRRNTRVYTDAFVLDAAKNAAHWLKNKVNRAKVLKTMGIQEGELDALLHPSKALRQTPGGLIALSRSVLARMDDWVQREVTPKTQTTTYAIETMDDFMMHLNVSVHRQNAVEVYRTDQGDIKKRRSATRYVFQRLAETFGDANPIVKHLQSRKRAHNWVTAVENLLSNLMGQSAYRDGQLTEDLHHSITQGWTQEQKDIFYALLPLISNLNDNQVKSLTLPEQLGSREKALVSHFLVEHFIEGGETRNVLMDENLLTSVSLAILDWLTTSGDTGLNNSAKAMSKLVNMGLGSSAIEEGRGGENREIFSQAEHKTYKNTGTLMGPLVHTLGKKIFAIYGLESQMDGEEHVEKQLIESLGMLAVNALLFDNQGAYAERYYVVTRHDSPDNADGELGNAGEPQGVVGLYNLNEMRKNYERQTQRRFDDDFVVQAFVRPKLTELTFEGREGRTITYMGLDPNSVLGRLLNALRTFEGDVVLQTLLGREVNPKLVAFHKADLSPTTTKTDGTPLSQLQVKAVKRLSESPFSFNMDMVNAYRLLPQEWVLQLAGAHTPEREAAEITQKSESMNAKRSNAHRLIGRMQAQFDAMLDVGTNAFYYNYSVGVGGRLSLMSQWLDPMGDKFALSMMGLKDWRVTVDSAPRREAFLLALAQHLGIKVDRQLPQNALTELQPLLAQMNAPIGDTGYSMKDVAALLAEGDVGENAATLQDYVDRTSRLYRATQALMDFAREDPSDPTSEADPLRFMAIMAYGQYQRNAPFETQLFLESDGLTSGTAIGALQFPSGITDVVQYANLARAGLYHQTQSDHTNTLTFFEAGNLDAYETLGLMANNFTAHIDHKLPPTLWLGANKTTDEISQEAWDTELFVLNDRFLPNHPNLRGKDTHWVSDTNSKPARIIKAVDYVFAKDAVMYFLGEMGRKLMKSPLMVFQYGAGLRSILRKLAFELVEGITVKIREVEALPEGALKNEQRRLLLNYALALFPQDDDTQALVQNDINSGRTLFNLHQVMPKDAVLSNLLYQGAHYAVAVAFGQVIDWAFRQAYAFQRDATEVGSLYVDMAMRAYEDRLNDAKAAVLADHPEQISLTRAQRQAIEADLRPYRPILSTALSDPRAEDGTLKGGIDLMARYGVNDYALDQAFDDRLGPSPYKVTGALLANDDTRTFPSLFNAYTVSDQFQDVGASAIPNQVHGIDSAVIMLNLIEHRGFGLHDAWLTSIDDYLQNAKSSARAMNKQFIEVNRDHSLLDAAKQAFLTAHKGRSEEEISGFMWNYLSERLPMDLPAKVVQSIVKTQIHELAVTENVVAERRAFLFSQPFYVHQYASLTQDTSAMAYVYAPKDSPYAPENYLAHNSLSHHSLDMAWEEVEAVSTDTLMHQTSLYYTELFRDFNDETPIMPTDNAKVTSPASGGDPLAEAKAYFQVKMRNIVMPVLHSGRSYNEPADKAQRKALVSKAFSEAMTSLVSSDQFRVAWANDRNANAFLLLAFQHFDAALKAVRSDDINRLRRRIKRAVNKAIQGQGSQSQHDFDLLSFVQPAADITQDNAQQIFDALLGRSAIQDDEAHVSHLRRVLDMIVRNALTPLQAKFRDTLENEAGAGMTVNTVAYVAVNSRGSAAPLEMSANELYVHELLHALINQMVDDLKLRGTQIWKMLENAYRDALMGPNAVTVEDFMVDPSLPQTSPEYLAAKARYEHTFYNALKDHQDRDGFLRTNRYTGATHYSTYGDPVVEFLVMSLSHAPLMKALARRNVRLTSTRHEKFSKWSLAYWLAVTESLLDRFRLRVAGAKHLTADKQLLGLFETLVSVNNRKKSRLFAPLSQAFDFASDRVLDPAIKKTVKATGNVLGTWRNQTDANGEQTKVAQFSEFLHHITGASGLTGTALRQAIDQWANYSRLYNHTFLVNLADQFGLLDHPQKMLQLLARSATVVERDTNAMRAAVGQQVMRMWRRVDEETLSEAMRHRLTRVLFDTDFEALINNNYLGRKDALKLLHKGSARAIDGHIRHLKERLGRDFAKDRVDLFDFLAEDVAHYMVFKRHRVRSNMQYVNAEQVARLYGTAYQVSYEALPNAEESVRLIDTLITLKALRLVDLDVRQSVYDVLAEETNDLSEMDGNGYHGLLTLINTMRSLSRSDNFNDDNAILMEKGYRKEDFDPYITVVLVDEDDVAQMTQEGYHVVARLSRDPHDPDKAHGKRVLMRNRDGKRTRHMTGILSSTRQSARGNNTYKRARNDNPDMAIQDVLENASANRDTIYAQKRQLDRLMVEGRVRDARVWDNNQGENGKVLTPLFNTQGKIKDYRYVMNTAMRLDVMNRDDDYANVLAHTISHSNNKAETVTVNNLLVDAWYDDFITNFAGDPNSENPRDWDDRFERISATESDPRLRQYWYLMPSTMQRHAAERFGDAYVFVRKTQVQLSMGFRAFSVATLETQSVTDLPPELDTAWRRLMVHFNNFAKRLFNNQYGIALEQGWQSIVTLFRDTVVIKSGVVTAANVASNMVLCWFLGVPIVDIVKGHISAYQQAFQYTRMVKELHEMNFDLTLLQNQSSHTAADTRKIATLEAAIRQQYKRIENLPIYDLVQAGVLSSVVDDVETTDGHFNQRNHFMETTVVGQKISALLDGAKDKTPEQVQVLVKNLLMTHDTTLYKFMRDLAQYSDFAARYTLHQHNLSNGMDYNDSIQDVMDTFINYDEPTTATMDYLNRMGVMMFARYFLRTQKVIFKVAKDNPGRLLMILLLSQVLLDVPTILDAFGFDALFNRLNVDPTNILMGTTDTLTMNVMGDIVGN